MCLLEGFCRIITISSHMITQIVADLKLKPRVSRRKLKGVLKLHESKMFSLCTGHVNQVHYPLDYEQSLFSWSVGHALVSRVSRLRRSTLARMCTLLTKSEEKETARSLIISEMTSDRHLRECFRVDWRTELL